MKRIESDEIFRNLSDFLRGKGIELTQGTYSRAVQKTCSVLTDTINLSQEGFEKVRTGAEKKLDQVRQVIHEKTAPRPPQTASVKPAPNSGCACEPQASAKPSKAASTKRQPQPKAAGKRKTAAKSRKSRS